MGRAPRARCQHLALWGWGRSYQRRCPAQKAATQRHPGHRPDAPGTHPPTQEKAPGTHRPAHSSTERPVTCDGCFPKTHAMPLKQVQTGERKTVPHQGQPLSATSQQCHFFFFFFLRLFIYLGFPGGSAAKIPPANAGDNGLIPGLGRSPGEGNGSLLQYSCLRNPMDRGTWWATVHRVAKSGT